MEHLKNLHMRRQPPLPPLCLTEESEGRLLIPCVV